MRNLPQDYGEYFSALRNLHSLTLFNTRIENIDEYGFRIGFSVFRKTLTYLCLERSYMLFGVFVTLVDYFPNIRTLRLGAFVREPEAGPVPNLSRPLRGRVEIYGGISCLDFLHRFARLDLQYDEVVIDTFNLVMEAKYLERALQLSATTVKILRLAVRLPRE